MTAPRPDLPTLTEIVNVNTPKDMRGTEPPAEFEATRPDPYLTPAAATPPSPQTLAYDEELVAQVMVRLQPRLEAWVEAQVRRALMQMLPALAESASLAIVRDLRSEMPELLSLALDEAHRQRHG